jgi:hypothetical protein
MNRAQRRAAQSRQRRRMNDGDLILYLDRPDLLRIVAEMVAGDETLGGATIIAEDGAVTHLDAATLRRGGSA